MGDLALRLLAKWRREGGTWRVTVRIEGYDMSFTYALPGKISKRRAEGAARRLCANETDEKMKHIFVVDTIKEGG